MVALSNHRELRWSDHMGANEHQRCPHLCGQLAPLASPLSLDITTKRRLDALVTS